MLKKKLFIFLLVLINVSFYLHGQDKITLTGIVQDSVQKPLEFANVILIKKGSTSIYTYAITDELGRFKVSIVKDSTYILKASFVGFEEAKVDATLLLL